MLGMGVDRHKIWNWYTPWETFKVEGYHSSVPNTNLWHYYNHQHGWEGSCSAQTHHARVGMNIHFGNSFKIEGYHSRFPAPMICGITIHHQHGWEGLYSAHAHQCPPMPMANNNFGTIWHDAIKSILPGELMFGILCQLSWLRVISLFLDVWRKEIWWDYK